MSRKLPPASNQSASSVPAEEKPKDLVVVQGPTEDQKGLRVLRARPTGIEAGELRPVEEGKPIYGNLLELEARKEAPFLFNVKSETNLDARARSAAAGLPAHADRPEEGTPEAKNAKEQGRARSQMQAASPQAAIKKPAKVASQAYRNNWDLIWSRPKKHELN